MADAKRMAGVGVLVVALAAAALWMSLRRSVTQTGEAPLDLSLMCAECGGTLHVDFDGLRQLAADAHARGAAVVDGRSRSPVGICPTCGKAALYRTDEDPQTGQPVLPEFARGAKDKAPAAAPPAAR